MGAGFMWPIYESMKINKNATMRKTKYQWHLIDWNQPTSWIADQLGARDQVVAFARRKYAPETIRKAHIKKISSAEKWAEVDWSKTDIEIAKEMNASRSGVWKARNRNLHDAI